MATGISSVKYWVDTEGLIPDASADLYTLLATVPWITLQNSSTTDTSVKTWSLGATAPTFTSGSEMNTEYLYDGGEIPMAPGEHMGTIWTTMGDYTPKHTGAYKVYLRIEDYAGNVSYAGPENTQYTSQNLWLEVLDPSIPSGTWSSAGLSYHHAASDTFTLVIEDSKSGIDLTGLKFAIERTRYGSMTSSPVTIYDSIFKCSSIKGEYYVAGTSGKVKKTVASVDLSDNAAKYIPYSKLTLTFAINDINQMAPVGGTEGTGGDDYDGTYKISVFTKSMDSSASSTTSVADLQYMYDTVAPSLDVLEEDENLLHYPGGIYAAGSCGVLKKDASGVEYTLKCTDANGAQVTRKMEYATEWGGSYNLYSSESLVWNYHYDAPNTVTYSDRVSFGQDGVYKITYTAYDNYDTNSSQAGVQGRTSSITVYVAVDTQAPSLTNISLNPNPASIGAGYSINMTIQDE